jgi:hypothetical protein
MHPKQGGKELLSKFYVKIDGHLVLRGEVLVNGENRMVTLARFASVKVARYGNPRQSTHLRLPQKLSRKT